MKQFFALLFITSITCCKPDNSHHTGYITAGKMRVYFERHGTGKPILLLHAGLQDQRMWQPQVKYLSSYFDVITIDLPYHGKTSGNDTTTLVSEVIKAVLDTLHINKVSLAGLSMGTNAVQDFAIAYPKRVDKIMLISAGINGYDRKYPVDSLSMNWYLKFDKALKQKDTVEAAKEFTKAWAEGIYRSKDSLRQPVSKYVLNSTLSTIRKHKLAYWPKLNEHPSAINRISEIKAPTMIVNGDKDLPYVTSVSIYLQKHIPGSKQVVIKDVAHMLNLEKPQELNKLMKEFFE